MGVGRGGRRGQPWPSSLPSLVCIPGSARHKACWLAHLSIVALQKLNSEGLWPAP